MFNFQYSERSRICSNDCDNTNRNIEAQYWKDEFLHLDTINNEYNQTDTFLRIAKCFVEEELSGSIPNADKIDLLNRSISYFKENGSFDKGQFNLEVLQDGKLTEAFDDFKQLYQQENNIKISESFEISPAAVKRQSRVFKRVIKLDKNFHIYIHGDKDLIEQGVDKDGRKFYKIYFENET